jgi:hypothetical protein
MIFEQIILILSCYLLLFISYFIGYFLLSTSINAIGYVFTGYGFIYILFLTSAIIKTNIVFYLCPLFLIGLCAYRFDSFDFSILKCDIKRFFIAQIIISPFLIYTLFLNNLNWDDYATWLPNAYYIYEHGHLPKSSMQSIHSSHPTYPYAFPIFVGIINKINGHFYENVAPIFNVIFLSLILTFTISNKKINFSEIFLKQLYLIPVLLLAVLIMNTKGIFGAGADLIICLLSCAYLFYDFKNITVDSKKQITFNFQNILFKTFMAIALVGTKQVGLYILLIVGSASFLTKIIVHSKSNYKINNILNISINSFIPIIIGYLVYQLWNSYAEVEGLRSSFGNFSIEIIRFNDINKILYSIWLSIIEKPYFLIALLFNLYLYIKYKDNNFMIRCFAISSFFTTIILLCFLVLAYLTIFGEYEGNRAASFERYIAPAGFINLISLLVVIDIKKHTLLLRNKKTYLYPIIIVIFYVVISVAQKNRIIRPSSINYSELINYFNQKLPLRSRINTFDFHSMGYIGHILTFKLYNQYNVTKYDPLNFDLKPKNINNYIDNNINLFFGQFNDKNIHLIIKKLNLKSENIIHSKELNLWILKVDR